MSSLKQLLAAEPQPPSTKALLRSHLHTRGAAKNGHSTSTDVAVQLVPQLLDTLLLPSTAKFQTASQLLAASRVVLPTEQSEDCYVPQITTQGKKRKLSEITDALAAKARRSSNAGDSVQRPDSSTGSGGSVCSTPPSDAAEPVELTAVIDDGASAQQPRVSSTTSSSTALSTLAATSSSKHNDVSYYPNIQCILCKEWVCSRNRYMHVESHLQYRPYLCSICGYDNRKEIFIALHLKRFHGGQGEVQYRPNQELEKRAWELAEECIQHTREVLLSGGMMPENANAEKRARTAKDQQLPTTCAPPIASIISAVVQSLASPVVAARETVAGIRSSDGSGKPSAGIEPTGTTASAAFAFRPRIFNNARLEKTMLIEESRQMGLVPDFSKFNEREMECHLCQSYILRNPILLEEHVRSHLSKPSYACVQYTECGVEHSSKNFIQRHMKEVHRFRKMPLDRFERDAVLLNEYYRIGTQAFPNYFTADYCTRFRTRYVQTKQQAKSDSFSDGTQTTDVVMARAALKKIAPQQCVACHIGLHFQGTDATASCVYCSPVPTTATANPLVHMCMQCGTGLSADPVILLRHGLTHMQPLPFSCALCQYADADPNGVWTHFQTVHNVDVSQDWSPLEAVTVSFIPKGLLTMWEEALSLCYGTDFVQRVLLSAQRPV